MEAIVRYDKRKGGRSICTNGKVVRALMDITYSAFM
jgi:hypothetical protein